MAELNQTRTPQYRGQQFISRPSSRGSDRDTNGGEVPVWKAHTFTYDGSGNLSTDTVTDGSNTWVRTFMWSNGAQTSDSGWVKQ